MSISGELKTHHRNSPMVFNCKNGKMLRLLTDAAVFELRSGELGELGPYVCAMAMITKHCGDSHIRSQHAVSTSEGAGARGYAPLQVLQHCERHDLSESLHGVLDNILNGEGARGPAPLQIGTEDTAHFDIRRWRPQHSTF